MCGIAGIYGGRTSAGAALGDGVAPNWQAPEIEARLGRMLQLIDHRGPDGQRIWVSPEGCALGHTRLAILDLAGGAQPIANEDGTLWLAVNGEIYNHAALRRQLAGRHTFRTQSDSEVILHLFEELGPACIERLDGMFAIAIWGPAVGLFLARDPLGIKALYHGRDAAGNLLFASELKALVDEVAEISELRNGTHWQVGQAPVPYFQVPQMPATTLTAAETAIRTLDSTLVAAVTKRLMADVPVGLFLSGGLDSSLIAAIARRRVEGELHSFAVGLEGSADLANARLVAEHLGTIHHERILAPWEIFDALPLVIRSLESFDPALVRSAIPTYFVSALAAQYVKVVLSGEGADELFAGYHYLEPLTLDPGSLADELHLITSNLHNSNLQRVDRMTMAHGLEGRVPFLDRTMVELGARIDPALKWREGHGKWILRKMAEAYLPAEIVWRQKEKFAIGTGIGPLLEAYAERVITESGLPAGWSKEEYLYWSLFAPRYGRADIVAAMGRSRSLNPGEVWVSALEV